MVVGESRSSPTRILVRAPIPRPCFRAFSTRSYSKARPDNLRGRNALYVLGEFAELSAASGIRRPLITAEGTREQVTKTAPDQIAVIGTLTSGAIASVHVREAVAGGIGFLWEINGTDGTLRITADAALPEIFPLRVAGARGRGEPVELPVPATLTQKWPALVSLEGAPAYNVGRAYAAFAEDIDNGTHTVPDFADAVRRHEVLAAIEKSAASGERMTA